MEERRTQGKSNTGWLAYMLPVRSIVFLIVFLTGAYLTGRGLRGVSSIWSVAASAVNILTILFLIIATKRVGSSYRELINYRKGSFKAKDIGTVIVFIITGMAGMYLAGYICYGEIPYMAPVMVEPINIILAAINVILLPVTTVLAEDGTYLGAGVNGIKNKYAGVAVPAFFYAVQHCFIPTIFDARYMIYRFISFLPLTVMFCIYYKRKKEPVTVMAAHAVLDMATAVTILVMSAMPGIYDQISKI